MALVGITLDEVRDFISSRDPDKENPTVFKIGALDPFLRSYLDDDLTTFQYGKGGSDAAAETTVKMGSRAIEVFRFGVKGIENFIHPQTKKAIAFDTVSRSVKGRNYQAVSDEIIRLLPVAIIREVASEISGGNILDADEMENLD